VGQPGIVPVLSAAVVGVLVGSFVVEEVGAVVVLVVGLVPTDDVLVGSVPVDSLSIVRNGFGSVQPPSRQATVPTSKRMGEASQIPNATGRLCPPIRDGAASSQGHANPWSPSEQSHITHPVS
jgi:hypothetical protein